INPATVKFTVSGGNADVLAKAQARYVANALALSCNAAADGAITSVTVSVTGTDPSDLAQADESYSLSTSATGVTITAAHTVGALRAIETLGQLTAPVQKLPFHVKTDAAGCATAASAGFKAGFVIPSGPWTISDKPSYSYRGVSLDTSRNYIPVSGIQKTLDAMASTKLNVLHWHIVDATSFPVVSTSYCFQTLAHFSFSHPHSELPPLSSSFFNNNNNNNNNKFQSKLPLTSPSPFPSELILHLSDFLRMQDDYGTGWVVALKFAWKDVGGRALSLESPDDEDLIQAGRVEGVNGA
ncbi:hypothetical protein HDU99_008840, partial [Rhizoclosmatium hyalinum]